jgi:hypothetical protein
VRHTFRVRCLAALSTGRDSFLVGELVGGSGGVCGLAATAGEGATLVTAARVRQGGGRDPGTAKEPR